MTTTPPRHLTVVCALLLTMAAACSGGSTGRANATTGPPSTSAAVTVSDVTIERSRFGPTEVSVAAGDTVTFTNVDPFAHTVTSRDDSAFTFDSGDMGQDESFDVQFDDAGTYAYFCRIHPTMRATVVVE